MMKKSILKLGKTLSKKEQKEVKGGFNFWIFPNTEEQCHVCNGEWEAPLCALSPNSPCLN